MRRRGKMYLFEDCASGLPFAVHDRRLGAGSEGKLGERQDTSLNLSHVGIDFDPVCFENWIFVVFKDFLLGSNILLTDGRFLQSGQEPNAEVEIGGSTLLATLIISEACLSSNGRG
jgi:hypothetical protein